MAFFGQKLAKIAKNRPKNGKNRQKIGIFAKKPRFSLKRYTKILLYKKIVVILHRQKKKNKFNNQNFKTMMLRISNEQRKLMLAKSAIKRGIATPEQIALVENLKAAKNEARREAKKAADAAAKSWAAKNEAEINYLRENVINGYYNQMEYVSGGRYMRAGIRYYHQNEDGTRDYQK